MAQQRKGKVEAATRAEAARPRRRSRRGAGWRSWIPWAVGLVVVAAAAVGAWRYANPPGPGQPIPIMPSPHIASPDVPHAPYNSDPPTSGPHTPYLPPWGIYREPLPFEVLVHSLEDGGVVIYYNRTVEGEELEALRSIVRQYGEYLILVPYPDYRYRFALTAWGRLDAFDEFDRERIVRFIEAYRGIDHHGEG